MDGPDFVASTRLNPEPRKIIHIDMDCFFAAVEVLDDPDLRGKPVIVGGPENHGVVCAASYEARKFGVRSAMSVSRARKLCRDGIFLPVRISRYKEVSRQIRQVLLRCTDLVEMLSLDEAYMDVTSNKWNLPYATDVARKIKASVLEECGLVASVGVAPNKFLAKIASEHKKPDGFFVIRPGDVDKFMQSLPVHKIWGVGKVTAERLKDAGVLLARDLLTLPEAFVLEKFGKWGPQLLNLARGIDESPVVAHSEPKSIGSETTFEHSVLDRTIIELALGEFASEVAGRLLRRGLVCRGVQLKIKYDDFSLVTRSRRLDAATSDMVKIRDTAKSLIDKTECGTRPIRLAGLAVYGLARADALTDLFAAFNQPELATKDRSQS